MRCKLIKEYAQLIKEDNSIGNIIPESCLYLLLKAVLEWDVEELKKNIESYKLILGKTNE